MQSPAAAAVFLQVYISRLQQLVAAAPLKPGGGYMTGTSTAAAGAAAEASQLVQWRRVHEDRRALFSHFYWALWCLNRREQEASGVQPPPGLWHQVLVALKLR